MQEKTTYTKVWESNQIQSLYERFSQAVKPFELPLVEEVVRKINVIFEGKIELSVFEIGTGSGAYTSVILEGIAVGRNIHYAGIDVSVSQKDAFDKTKKYFPKNIEVEEIQISSWQEYSVTKKFDVVLAQHSWYGIQGAAENFQKLKEILTPGGVCFIMLNPPSNLSYMAMKDNGEAPFSSDDIEGCLHASGLSFERIRLYNENHPREKFSVSGKLTEHGKDHLSYLYRKELQGNEAEVLAMLDAAPDDAYRFPTDILIVKAK